MAKRKRTTDHDSPWKEALELFLPQFLAFFFPSVFEAIDWTRGYESLDKELRQIAPEGEVGGRLADMLFKTWRHGGDEAWLCVHIEVQGRSQPNFPERMFVYHYRIFDRFRRFGVSLAVLTDSNANWRPDRFEYNTLGCEGRFRFLIVKILDYRGREATLEEDPNPFAAIVLAQLAFLQTRQAPEERRIRKFGLIKKLYLRELSAKQIRQLFRLIDWMLRLPKWQDTIFWGELRHFEEERRMPYITSVERYGREQGRVEALLEWFPLFLETKFGKEGKELLPEIRDIKDAAKLTKMLKAVKKAKTIDDLRQRIRE